MELCDRLASERQLQVTPRELQTWRRLGLVSHYTVALGRGKGRRPYYLPEAVDEAAEVAEVLAGFKSLDFAVLELFGRGRNPTLAALKHAYKWWLDRTEAQAHEVLALFDGNGKVFSRRVRDEIHQIGEAFPALAKHLEKVCREAAQAEEPLGDGEPPSVLDIRQRIMADHFASFVDADEFDPELRERAFIPRVGPAVPDDAVGRPPIPAARAALDTATLEQLTVTRDFLQFSALFANRGQRQNIDEILDGPVSTSGLFGTMALFALATDPPLLAHSGALERLPVIAFDRDCAPLLPSLCPAFAYWRIHNGSGYDVGDFVLDPLMGGKRERQGYVMVLLLSQCSPRHPAIAVSDRLAAGHGRVELDEVWFVLLLRWDTMNRMMLSDQRSRELGRLLLEGVPRPQLYVPSPTGLLIPGHLANSDSADTAAPRLPPSPVAPAVFRSPARDEKIARARAFLTEYVRQASGRD